ncbi:MAG: hypothetical protein ACF8R7_11685 [Phycisphaerales bacterium JB039]
MHERTSPGDIQEDPTVEEIRAIRRRFWQEADRDLARYIRQAREATERLRESGELPDPEQRGDASAA